MTIISRASDAFVLSNALFHEIYISAEDVHSFAAVQVLISDKVADDLDLGNLESPSDQQALAARIKAFDPAFDRDVLITRGNNSLVSGTAFGLIANRGQDAASIIAMLVSFFTTIDATYDIGISY